MDNIKGFLDYAEFTSSPINELRIQDIEDSTPTYAHDFSYTKIINTRIENKIIRDSNFKSCDIRESRFRNNDFTRSNFGDSYISETNVSGTSFVDSLFYGTEIIASEFYMSNFQGSSFTDAEIKDSLFENSEMSGTIFSDTILENVNFDRCNLQGSNFNKTLFLSEVTFESVDMKGVRGINNTATVWSGGDALPSFYFCKFSYSDFYGVDLSWISGVLLHKLSVKFPELKLEPDSLFDRCDGIDEDLMEKIRREFKASRTRSKLF